MAIALEIASSLSETTSGGEAGVGRGAAAGAAAEPKLAAHAAEPKLATPGAPEVAEEEGAAAGVVTPAAAGVAEAEPEILPDLIIFSDGNEPSFGTVAYVLWTLLDGSRRSRKKSRGGCKPSQGKVIQFRFKFMFMASLPRASHLHKW